MAMCACRVVIRARSVARASCRWCSSRVSGEDMPKPYPETGLPLPQPKRVEVAVGDVSLSLSNLDKLMYPAAGFTKGRVIDYYTRIAPVLLAHLPDPPLTLKRYPDGVTGGHFYEKRCPKHR